MYEPSFGRFKFREHWPRSYTFFFKSCNINITSSFLQNLTIQLCCYTQILVLLSSSYHFALRVRFMFSNQVALRLLISQYPCRLNSFRASFNGVLWSMRKRCPNSFIAPLRYSIPWFLPFFRVAFHWKLLLAN